MKSQRGKQTIAIHILPNISRIKSNQAMTFDQLIEYNMRNSFLDGETIPRPFSKKPKFSISRNK